MLPALLMGGAFAAAAYGFRLLTAGGAVAATVVGTAAVLRGMEWILLLLFFFVTSSALSRWRDAEREALTGSLVEKGGRRDAAQVIANGGVFAVAAFLSPAAPQSWQAIAAGAIAASTADTWSTEVGTVMGGTPRHMITGQTVVPGTSGGVTLAGSVAGIAAAVLAALLVRAVDWQVSALAVVAGGLIGSAGDSLLGATIQERRWCETCSTLTERRTHTCGTPSVHRSGLRGCTNDVVNLWSTIAGAGATWTLT